MKFIKLMLKNRIVFHNLDEMIFLNLLPTVGQDMQYGEIFFRDGTSHSIDFSQKKIEELEDLICSSKSLISFIVIEEREDA